LTILVNFSHSLSPEAKEIFEVANDDFVNRLDSNFNAHQREIYIQPEDFPKILNLLLDHKFLSHELKQAMIDYLQENLHYFNYTVLSDLAVVYASKMDSKYRDLFFKRYFKDKFLKELRHLDPETFYKVLWSLVKAEAVSVNEQGGSDWSLVKEAIVAKMKEFEPKTLTNILVLATVAKSAEGARGLSGDLFD
jgi:hypothetical protein